MGGLAVDVSRFHDRLKKVFLTPNGVIHLAQKGYFFDVPDKDIKDKGKANSLAKGLVLIQITWTVLQCLGRKVAGLPLSILEVHVLAHAGCALIMYTLWFRKPLDIEEPTDVSSRIPDDIVALMLVQNYRFGTKPYGSLGRRFQYRPARKRGTGTPSWPSPFAAEAEYLMHNPSMFDTREHAGESVPPVQELAVAAKSRPTTIPALMASYENSCDAIHLDDSAFGCPRTSLKKNISFQMSPKSNTPLSLSLPERSGLTQGVLYGDPTSPKLGVNGVAASREPIASILETDLNSMKSQRTNEGAAHDTYGFSANPVGSIVTTAVLYTGSFLSGGIGPRAFVCGPRNGDLIDSESSVSGRPGEITQISDVLRKRLPLHEFDPSTIAYCMPMSIALSEKDVRRWQLAGAALKNDIVSKNPQPTSNRSGGFGGFYADSLAAQNELHQSRKLTEHSSDCTFLTFESSGGTLRGAYFEVSLPLHNMIRPLGDEFIQTVWRISKNSQREILLLRSLRKRLYEIQELQMGSTSAVMMLPGLVYGGLHLTLWAHDFPTRVELLLWRISAISLVAVPVAIALPLIVYNLFRKLNGRNSDFGDINAKSGPADPDTDEEGTSDEATTTSTLSLLQRICVDFAVAVVLIVFLLYVFSRVFIIVESFISLRHVPVGVYTDVGWSKYIPHF